MRPLEMVGLPPLMARGTGRPETVVALIDGSVATGHPELAGQDVRILGAGAGCPPADRACGHGTFVAGVLKAGRSSAAPGICPGCTLLVRPVFGRASPPHPAGPGARPDELVAALTDVVDAGGRVINLSLSVARPGRADVRALVDALDHAADRGAIIVAAAGNQGLVDSTVITRHPAVVPVVSYTARGRPMARSNLGTTIGRRGLGAPGEAVVSLGADGGASVLSGTSAAVPFVTGAVALLWSQFPAAPAAAVRYAVTRSPARPRRSVVPPLLDARAAYRMLAACVVTGRQSVTVSK